jgi:hypothetical protein
MSMPSASRSPRKYGSTHDRLKPRERVPYWMEARAIWPVPSRLRSPTET